MTPASERRFTKWCEDVFLLLGPVSRRQEELGLLVFQAPGNPHTVGARFAERILNERGLATQAVDAPVSFDEMISLMRSARPRFVGFSCAMPYDVGAATGLISRLRAQVEPELSCRYVLSGFAIRQGCDAPARGVELVRELDFFSAGSQAASEA